MAEDYSLSMLVMLAIEQQGFARPIPYDEAAKAVKLPLEDGLVQRQYRHFLKKVDLINGAPMSNRIVSPMNLTYVNSWSEHYGKPTPADWKVRYPEKDIGSVEMVWTQDYPKMLDETMTIWNIFKLSGEYQRYPFPW